MTPVFCSILLLEYAKNYKKALIFSDKKKLMSAVIQANIDRLGGSQKRHRETLNKQEANAKIGTYFSVFNLKVFPSNRLVSLN